MSNVFVVDANRTPLDPVHPGYARLLLTQRKAAVLRRFPFTLILKAVVEQPQAERLRVKLDPGSKTTGLAIVNETTGEVVFAAELCHRGAASTKTLAERRRVRHSRRSRHTRYRKPRFANRKRRPGWLPPSLESRVCNVVTWVKRLLRICPISSISQELVRFDMQALQQPEISGIEYQQGTKVKGFQTGDMVRAVVRTGTKVGTYTGRVAIRTRGSFNIATACGTVKDISHRFCRVLHHCDGYSYQKGERAMPPAP